MRLIIVSGLSGAGKNVVLHTLEDQGYYCVDNLPVRLLEPFAHQMRDQALYENAAVAVDARNRDEDLRLVPKTVATLREQGVRCEIIFLHTDDETLLKRFSETRRRHPLTREGVSLAEAIRMERHLMEPLFANADLHLETTHTALHELRDLVRRRVAEGGGEGPSVLLQSFGYKHGVPGDADFVFDARCLPNPYWEPRLRAFTGRDRVVQEFLGDDPLVDQVFAELRDFLVAWLPRFGAENRSYITVAVGCTGGQHRSVYLVERLAQYFDGAGQPVLTRHRELP